MPSSPRQKLDEVFPCASPWRGLRGALAEGGRGEDGGQLPEVEDQM